MSYDPGRRRWDVSAISPKYSGRLRPPATIQAHGEDELHALTEVVIKLRELRAVEQRMALEENASVSSSTTESSACSSLGSVFDVELSNSAVWVGDLGTVREEDPMGVETEHTRQGTVSAHRVSRELRGAE